MMIQINRAGRPPFPSFTGMPIVGPSHVPVAPVPSPWGDNAPHELSPGEIGRIVDAFTVTAEVEKGFVVIEDSPGRRRQEGCEPMVIAMGSVRMRRYTGNCRERSPRSV